MKLHKLRQKLFSLYHKISYMTVHEASLSKKDFEDRSKDLDQIKFKIEYMRGKLERVVQLENRLPVHINNDYSERKLEISNELKKIETLISINSIKQKSNIISQ